MTVKTHYVTKVSIDKYRDRANIVQAYSKNSADIKFVLKFWIAAVRRQSKNV
jgi:hypothetical protein